MRARDAAGNLGATPERLIHLAPPPGGKPRGTVTPPTTTPPPSQPRPPAGPNNASVSPPGGSAFQRGDTLEVRATVTASGGVGQVRLLWTAPAGTTPFAMADLGGGEYGIDIQVSSAATPGARSFQIEALDGAGRQTRSPALSVDVQ